MSVPDVRCVSYALYNRAIAVHNAEQEAKAYHHARAADGLSP